jgi:hypothetical protein
MQGRIKRRRVVNAASCEAVCKHRMQPREDQAIPCHGLRGPLREAGG